MATSRNNLQKLAQLNYDDSRLLLQNERYCNSYYLAGYAVELALKACVAKQIRAEEIPDKATIDGVYTHNFDHLIGLAGLRAEMKAAQDDDPSFHAYWGITGEWSPSSRYDIIDSMSAQLLLTAIGDTDHGVLRWIKIHW